QQPGPFELKPRPAQRVPPLVRRDRPVQTHEPLLLLPLHRRKPREEHLRVGEIAHPEVPPLEQREDLPPTPVRLGQLSALEGVEAKDGEGGGGSPPGSYGRVTRES